MVHYIVVLHTQPLLYAELASRQDLLPTVRLHVLYSEEWVRCLLCFVVRIVFLLQVQFSHLLLLPFLVILHGYVSIVSQSNYLLTPVHAVIQRELVEQEPRLVNLVEVYSTLCRYRLVDPILVVLEGLRAYMQLKIWKLLEYHIV